MSIMWKVFLQNILSITHIEQDHHQNEPNSNVSEKPKIDNVNTNNNNNNRTLLIGASFSGETYLLLKILP